MSDTALVIMARYPEMGKVKTRLARSIGDPATFHLYHAFLTDLAQRFAGWTCDLHWAYAHSNTYGNTHNEVNFDAFATTLAPCHASSMHSFVQRGLDLGERLHHAFHTTYERHYPRTVLIGSDSPHIGRNVIFQAQQALERADVVLGPAEDGGYYLIAMREPHDVFSGIPMSTEVVLQMTIDKAHRQGLSTCLLEPLFDVDELSDLVRLARLLQKEPALAPATAAQLAHLERDFDFA